MTPPRNWPTSSIIRPDLLLTLPRELRDEIYKYTLIFSTPIPIKAPHFSGISPGFWKHNTLDVEAVEAFYSINTFTLDLEADPSHALSEHWGPHPHMKEHICHLSVMCGERFSTKTASEYEQTNWSTRDRRRWTQLLELPRLKTLTINMQKLHESTLFTMDFGPILYKLRGTRPGIKTTFNISFDTKLQSVWDDPMWQQLNPNPRPVAVSSSSRFLDPTPNRYQKMGYIDASDIVAPPSDEDKEYVEEYLPQKKLPPVPGAGLGLMSESVANRKVLAKHYLTREPALLRVLMEEHYHIYLKMEKEREAARAADDEAKVQPAH
jgi:hypothetical protein